MSDPTMSRRHSTATRANWSIQPTRMLDDDPSPTCLSDLSHGPAAAHDLLRHYFGCIKIHQRDGFLDRSNAFWRERADIEFSKIVAATNDDVEESDRLEMQYHADRQVEKAIAELAISIEAQYKKTGVLRRALSKETVQWPPPRPPTVDGNLVLCIDQSRKAWRASQEYRQGIEKVRSWKRLKSLRTDPEASLDTVETEPEYGRQSVREIIRRYRPHSSLDERPSDYDVERDAKAYLIQYTFMPHPKADHSAMEGQSHSFSDTITLNRPAEPTEEKIEDVRFEGRFPHQHVSVDLLLRSGSDKSRRHGLSNILSRELCHRKDPTRLRYIHLPFNNMEWVESVIAGYYDDPPPALSVNQPDASIQTQTQMLLRPELWRGQQNGAWSGTAHARHMRPLCERTSSEVNDFVENPENIVLFMPYMGWETDRTKEVVSKVVEAESERYRKRREASALEKKQAHIQRRHELGGNGKRITHSDSLGMPEILSKSKAPLRFLAEIPSSSPKQPPGKVRIAEDGRLLVASALGQYLIDAARLYEGMSAFQDQQMVEKYLYRDPPFHPRRTLDQFRHPGLKRTKARDRSQVVYRGTSDMPAFRHRLVRSMRESATIPAERSPAGEDVGRNGPEHRDRDGEETTSGSRRGILGKQDKPDLRWRWTGHWSGTDDKGCEHCASDIKKTPKLIMVDQLWMWVLDEKTVITAFPGRYGNGYDRHLDGIHKSIRNRLRSARIWSAFDIALIILDECSTTFFSRTGIDNSQPRVLDIFSEAIGRVTNLSTISLGHVWHWGEKASEIFRSKYRNKEESKLYLPLLDINVEGKLLQEVKDILEEVDIMLSILKRQREIIRIFGKNVEQIVDPGRLWATEPDGMSSTRFFSDGEEGRVYPGQHAFEVQSNLTRKRTQLLWFRVQSLDLINKVSDRMNELEDLREGAKSTAQDVFDLLTLKQQQANVFQIGSLTNAEEAVRQGRAVMMFTVVTIIFVSHSSSYFLLLINEAYMALLQLPLSFMASVFGMNNSSFGDDHWSLEDQFRLMFPISFGIVLISIVFAFYDFLRILVWSVYTYIITWITVRTGLYHIWLGYKGDLGSASLQLNAEREVSMLKERARMARKRKNEEVVTKRVSDSAMEDENMMV
ncbi:hypothetical protein B0T26DRAFT_735298 [Lasiosphaeria miniovina]|uniref:Uncharacterized protein n=1 Tax=Lasiosphaeria miniovina TaxID=1954250 RepID=A0AA39ZQY1_9PEZI|nr:uncharacterized protein B0T26DRAFT_735298 [Lasiosphaeria miniovina]KAK0701938.1 hypothetical protein B0T26DRAFT_735298 [Lasiosphaeria miniovina]